MSILIFIIMLMLMLVLILISTDKFKFTFFITIVPYYFNNYITKVLTCQTNIIQYHKVYAQILLESLYVSNKTR